jgi:hypothetical protein
MGVTTAHAGAVMDLLWAMSREEVEHHLTRGARYIHLYGDLAVPRLLPPVSSFEDLGIDPTEVPPDSPLLDVRIAQLDVGVVWARLLAALAQLDAPATAQTAPARQ